MTFKLLIYADSRGQHTPRSGTPYEIFTKKLANRSDIDAKIFLCPMKWTTTIDFLDVVEQFPVETFDRVILYTGIVDWSPRPQFSAINDLYDNQKLANTENLNLNTDEYSRKVINNKKSSFDNIFSEEAMRAHLGSDFGVNFERKPTINMYSLGMARDRLLPRLARIENLIFINSNRFVMGWKGDHARGRPINIALTEQYSALFRDTLGAERVVDLLAWDESDVRRFTCDNMHLTKEGSEYIYREICSMLRLDGAVPRTRRPRKASCPAKSPSSCSQPIISVIVPVFNTEKYLESCLTSLAKQDDPDVEVIIVDDGSTDRSPEIIARYCNAFTTFRSIRQKNNGLGAARNKGLSAAQGEFVTFVDSDDLVVPTYVSELRRIQQQGDHDVVTAGFARISECGEQLPKQIIDTQELGSGIGQLQPYQIVLGVFRSSISCARLYRKSLIMETGVRFYGRLPHEDLCFTYKVLYFAKSHGETHDELYLYRQREGSLSRAVTKEHVDVIPTQWRDTCEFLSAIDGSAFDHALAERRTLILAEGLLNRSNGVEDEIRTALRAAYNSGGVDLESMIGRFKASPLSGTYEVERLEKRLMTVSVPIFPHISVNLNNYEAKEVGKNSRASEGLADLYNKFKGGRCFIIGNGPSLNKHDLNLLRDERVFAVNSFFYKTDETGFRPTFYVVEDNMVMTENIERIRAYEAPYKLFPSDYRHLHPEGPNIYFFRMNQGFYQKSSPNYCVPRFSTDASKVLYCGQSVTYINLQLAYFLGFTEVYLIGMDFNYVIPREHERRGNHILSTTDDPNHFHKDYFGKGKTWKDPKLDRVAANYRQAKLAYEAVGRKIYNATIGGKLEIFDRVDYESLLRHGKKIRGPGGPERASVPLRTIESVQTPARRSSGESVNSQTTMTIGASKEGITTVGPPLHRPFYASFGDWLKERSPRVYVGAAFFRRGLAGLWRRRAWTIPVLIFIAALAGLGFLPALSFWRGLFWGASAFGALGFGLFYVSLRVFQLANSVLAQANRLAALEKKVVVGESAARREMSAEIKTAKSALKAEIAHVAALTKSVDEALSAKFKKDIAVAAEVLRQERAEDKEELERAYIKIESALNKELETGKHGIARLRERIAASERQIGDMRYPDAPSTFVFFGHHKCASRLFRSEVFTAVADATGARVRQYQVKDSPFHYEKGEDLDLANIDFSRLGVDGRDIVLFSNATERSRERICRATENWKGLRILRDPRQVLVSGYFHHKGDHHTELNGWVWDRLVEDKPILRELPEEEGLLYELDHISKEVIEEQLLAEFDDERVLTVKVEEFDENQTAWLLKISEFLNVPDIAGVNFSRTFANPNSGKWRHHFTSRLRQVFKERYGQALVDLGYAEDFDW